MVVYITLTYISIVDIQFINRHERFHLTTILFKENETLKLISYSLHYLCDIIQSKVKLINYHLLIYHIMFVKNTLCSLINISLI